MRGFRIAAIDCPDFGVVDEEFYEARKDEAQRIVALYGDNGLITLNRDLEQLNRRMRRYKDVDEEMYEGLAAQVRAIYYIIQELAY